MSLLIIWLVCLLHADVLLAQDANDTLESSADDAEHAAAEAGKVRIAATVAAILEHYKQADPVGIPIVQVPDPLETPDMDKSLGMANLKMMQVKAYGLSKFRIVSVEVDAKLAQLNLGVNLDEMVVRGNYQLSSFFSKANGPFTVLLKKVFVKATATLAVDSQGHLATDRITMDMTFGDMSMDFQNLGFLGSVFQGIINSSPHLVFDSMKPFMVQKVDQDARAAIDKMLDEKLGDRRLPNSITPVDTAIAMMRKMVREKGFDPYHLSNFNRTMGAFSVHLTNTWIYGVSNFYRVGNITVSMFNNTAGLRFQLGTQQISGSTQWEVGVALMSRIGHVQFSVQHLRVTVEAHQPLDTRQRIKITDLQLDLGNIQVRSDGAGTLDYVMEFGVNVLPNLLRYQIMDAIEGPLMQRGQELFNNIDSEQFIKDFAQKYEETGKMEFDVGAFMKDLKFDI
ncbi:CG3246 [Drosophila busckii]|uniref:CG3246 n=2 Tax=Drosophila busckii TaxID=30019 RepID=A0A0M4EQ93_DROBS|nr:CG3246 [Drosophila busckii]